MAIKNKAQKFRFALVGVANTGIDFTIFFSLTALTMPPVIANLVSTSVAFCFSFFASKKYTFRVSGGDVKREVLLFVVVTLFGLWVLQTIVIKITTLLLDSTPLSMPLILTIAKILAVIVSLTWNYMLYSRVVFKRKET